MPAAPHYPAGSVTVESKRDAVVVAYDLAVGRCVFVNWGSREHGFVVSPDPRMVARCEFATDADANDAAIRGELPDRLRFR